MEPRPDLRGKVALVTGAGRGIGRATALALARCGARVVLAARTREQIEGAAREIEAAGGSAQPVVCDVGDEESVRNLIGASDGPAILVNNAGVIQPIAPVAHIAPRLWRENMRINLDGVFLTCHYALPAMLERGWGRIVNVSTGAARGQQTAWAAYAAAKGGVEVLTKVLALEVGPRGVHVNAVRPGIVDTAMQAEIRESPEEEFGRENRERFRGYRERGLLRPPEDAARLILWLLSAEAEGLNGEVLAIDDPEVAARIGVEPRGR
jgi:NAD(P)-dependent dehydrogenase (short-subunit alcohol dehydrogenase family)